MKIENGNVKAEPIAVKYDAGAVIKAIDELHYPDADNIKKFFYGVG